MITKQEKPRDTAAIYGPPDKQQHFLNDEDDLKQARKRRAQVLAINPR